MNAKLRAFWVIAWLYMSISIVMVGCGVAMPAKVTSKVVEYEPPSRTKGIKINLGPRRLLTNLADEINNSDKSIEIIDGIKFRDAVLIDGNWSLDGVLASDALVRGKKELDVSYIVIVDRLRSKTRDEEIFMFPPLGGKFSGEKVSTISAIIIDIRTGEKLKLIKSTATGLERAYNYLLYMVGTEANTDNWAVRELADAIVRSIVSREGASKVRIALMAAETYF